MDKTKKQRNEKYFNLFKEFISKRLYEKNFKENMTEEEKSIEICESFYNLCCEKYSTTYGSKTFLHQYLIEKIEKENLAYFNKENKVTIETFRKIPPTKLQNEVAVEKFKKIPQKLIEMIKESIRLWELDFPESNELITDNFSDPIEISWDNLTEEKAELYLSDSSTPSTPNSFIKSTPSTPSTPEIPIFIPKKKIGLCIGNEGYLETDEFSRLNCCCNDASIVHEKLQKIGFNSIMKKNLKNKEMKETLKEMIKSIEVESLIFFFFSGHGAELNQKNKIFGIDSTNSKYSGDELIDIQEDIIREIKNRIESFSLIIVLDACRIEMKQLNKSIKKEIQISKKSQDIVIVHATNRGEYSKTGEKFSRFTEIFHDQLISEDTTFSDVITHTNIELGKKYHENAQEAWTEGTTKRKIFLNKK